jgi:hypothetical protein
MSLPLYMKDAFSYPVGLVLATLIGFGFGFALERAGFGRSTVLAAQFYFRDMRVLKVMFSAIVTALLGMTLLAGVGVLDLSALQVPPTFIWPQLVGGLLLGVGFIVSGYCPGTGVVAFASGKMDGLAAILGVMAGSLAFGLVHPAIHGFYMSGAMGTARFPELLGIPQPFLALGVALMAIGAFVGAEKLEGIFARKDRAEGTEPAAPVRRRVFRAFAAAAALGLVTLLVPHAATPRAEKPVGAIGALELAELSIDDPASYFLVDVRPSATPEKRIPGSLAIPEDDPDGAFLADLPATRKLILYSENDDATVPPGAGRFGGEVLVLRGGYRAFAAEILEPPKLPESPSASEIADYRMRSALHASFTGTAARVETPQVQPRASAGPAKKKGGGC